MRGHSHTRKTEEDDKYSYLPLEDSHCSSVPVWPVNGVVEMYQANRDPEGCGFKSKVNSEWNSETVLQEQRGSAK